MKQKGKRKQLLLTIQELLEREDCTLDNIAATMIAGGYDVAHPAQKEGGSQNRRKRTTNPRLTSSGNGAAPTGDRLFRRKGDVGDPAAPPTD